MRLSSSAYSPALPTSTPPGEPTICPQLGAPDVIGTEDCLTLDVWTPLAEAREPVPVKMSGCWW